MKKMLIAFVLGVLSVPVGFVLGEGPGLLAVFSGLGIYFFVCQFFLSRGNAGSILSNWPVMLALDGIQLIGGIFTIVLGGGRTALIKGASHWLSTPE